MSTDSRGESALPPRSQQPARPEIVVCRGPDELTRRAAELFVTLAQRYAVEEGARFTVALSGGSTPQNLYRLLATPEYSAQVPWDRVHLFWGDERHVPPDDPQSNYRMAQETLISRVPIPRENVYRIRSELPDAGEAARDYEAVLCGFFGLEPDDRPRFDLILLGMGDDGHTASLFPGTDALHERERLVVAPWVAKFNTHRITLTAPVIDNAANVVFLVAGAGKAATLREVLEGPYDPDRLPSQLIRPLDGTLTWLVDSAAAAQVQT